LEVLVKEEKKELTMAERYAMLWRVAKLFRPFAKPIGITVAVLFTIQLVAVLSQYAYGRMFNWLREGSGFAWAAFACMMAARVANNALRHARVTFERRRLDYDLDEHLTAIAVRKRSELSIGQHVDMDEEKVNRQANEGVTAVLGLFWAYLYNIVPPVVGAIGSIVALFMADMRFGAVLASAAVFVTWFSFWVNGAMRGKIIAFDHCIRE